MTNEQSKRFEELVRENTLQKIEIEKLKAEKEALSEELKAEKNKNG